MYDPTMWDDPEKQRLLLAITHTQSKEQAKAVLSDLLTLSEIDEISRRLTIAALLDKGESYHAIREITGASTTTIASVSKSFQEGSGGYRLALDTLVPQLDEHYTNDNEE